MPLAGDGRPVPAAEATILDPPVAAAAPELLLRRSFGGASWMLILAAGSLVFGLVTNALLGRAGPESLGFYTFVVVGLSMASTFFVLGGNHLVITFLPKLTGERPARFLATYAAILIVFATAALALCSLWPGILDVLFVGERQPDVLFYMTLFVPIAVIQMLTWSFLQSQLWLRELAISQHLVSLVTCATLGVALVVHTAFGTGNPLESRSYILAAVLAANGGAIAFAMLVLLRRRAGRGLEHGWRPFLPSGFWRFAVFFQLGTVAFFVTRFADQLFVLERLGVRELGFYRPAVVVAQLVGWFAMVTDWVVYPSFCNLPPDRHADAHTRFTTLNVLGTSLAALVALLFSAELLAVFGASEGPDTRTVLLVLAAATAVAAPFVSLNNSVMMARQRVGYVLLGNLAAGVAGLVGYIALGRRFGVVGIAAGFAVVQAALLVASSVAGWHVARLRPAARPLGIALTTTAAGLLGAVILPTTGLVAVAETMALVLASVAVLVATRLVRPTEVRELLHLLAMLRDPATTRRDGSARG